MFFIIHNAIHKSNGHYEPVRSFKMECIEGIGNIKGADTSMLEMFLEQVYIKYPDIMKWPEDVPYVVNEKRMKSKELYEHYKKQKKQYRKILDYLKSLEDKESELKSELENTSLEKKDVLQTELDNLILLKKNLTEFHKTQTEPVYNKSKELYLYTETFISETLNYFSQPKRNDSEIVEIDTLFNIFCGLSKKTKAAVENVDMRRAIERRKKLSEERKKLMTASIGVKRKAKPQISMNLFGYDKGLNEKIKAQLNFLKKSIQPLKENRKNNQSMFVGKFSEEQKFACIGLINAMIEFNFDGK